MGWFSKLFGPKPTAMSPFDFVRRIVGEAHIFITDGESVDDASDYISVVTELAKIAEIHFDRITCVEVEPSDNDDDDDDLTRLLTLTRGAQTWTRRLRGRGWIDERVVDALNETLVAAGKRLYVINYRDWGQELCVVFATPLVIQELRVADYQIEGDPDEEPPEQEQVLSVDRVLHGHLFRAGTTVEYWIDPPYDAMEATLAAPHELAGVRFPTGTQILFKDEGGLHVAVAPLAVTANGQTAAANTRIVFERGAWQLASAEPV